MANPFATAVRLQDRPTPRASFDGAQASRLFFDWVGAGSFHPDRETRWSLRALRGRARDLVRNNPYARGVPEVFADNIIGWEGIRVKPRVKDPISGDPDRGANGELQRGWDDWGLPRNASVDGQESWLELQRLIVKTWVTDGEVFLRKRKGFRNDHAFALQMLDADLLDESYNVPPDENGVEIRMGVEMDGDGRRLAYHFWKEHPRGPGLGRKTGQRERIPADQIIHFFIRYRPGQTRGFSLFAPVLTTLKMLDGMTEAELVASRMAAATMGFITNNEPGAVDAYAQRLAFQNDEGEDAQPRTMDVAPGIIEELMPGQGFEGFDPTHPNTAFEPFIKLLLRGVSRGFGISYLTMTGDVAEANYSSMRAGLLPERDHWRALQAITALRIHSPVYSEWVPTAQLTGAVFLQSRPGFRYTAHQVKPRGWKWVDPLKDLMAEELGISLGVSSRTDAAADQGRDFEATVDEIRDELDYAEEKGVDVSGPDGTTNNAALALITGSNGNGSKNGKGGRDAVRRALLHHYLTEKE